MIFTPEDYWKYKNLLPIEDDNVKNNDKINGDTYHYHDKIFKEILSNEEEILLLIRKYLGYDKSKEIEKDDLEKYDKEFITKKFRKREADLLYKIKEKEIFILIEHQSTVDKNMAERVTTMCLEIIESRNIKRGIKNEYPLIVPIVLYTGTKKWNSAFTITEKQTEMYGFPIQEYPRYNLIDVNEYKKEQLIQEDSRISKAMLFEKVKTKEEIKEIFTKLLKRGLTEKEKQYLIIILTYSNFIKRKFTQEEIEGYKKVLERGGVEMTRAERFFEEILDDKFSEIERKATKSGMEKGMQRGMQKGMEKGIQKGMQKGIKQAVIGMINIKMKDTDIKRATNISEQELQKIKKEVMI